jgi:hypothetical protein
MIGTQRLDNVVECCVRAVAEGVPGDFIETGVWRGGTTILMRGVLEAMGEPDRSVWVADSFEGLPVPDEERYPADAGLDWSQVGVLKGKFAYMSPEQVRGRQIDQCSDLFALGVIFYEMLTGTKAFGGGSTREILELVSRARPAPINE